MENICFKLNMTVLAVVCVCLSAFGRIHGKIICDGQYDHHLQGVATDGESLYWSFTTKIVRTDLSGKILALQIAPSHQGDLCFRDGAVYVAVNRGRFNQENEAISEVTSYDAKTLKPLKTWPLAEMPHGAGGMTWRGGRFFVVGGLPATHECNYVYEYTGEFKLVRRYELKTGFTLMGIQTAAFEDGNFYFGIYGGKGNPPGVLKVSQDFSACERYTGPGSIGIVKLGGRFYTARIVKNASMNGQSGCINVDDLFCDDSRRYVPERNGGRLRIFYADRDVGKWEDCGYNLLPDGYRPLTQYHKVFLPAAGYRDSEVAPAVCIDSRHSYAIADLVRGIRRIAEQNEVLAVCLPGSPDMIAADKKLSDALSAVVREAQSLGVKVMQ